MNNIEMNVALKLIADHYGLDNQRTQLYQEYSELIVALTKYDKTKPETLANVIEEVADSLVMVRQIAHLLDIPDDIIYEQMAYKIQRQLKRMENENE